MISKTATIAFFSFFDFLNGHFSIRNCGGTPKTHSACSTTKGKKNNKNNVCLILFQHAGAVGSSQNQSIQSFCNKHQKFQPVIVHQTFRKFVQMLHHPSGPETRWSCLCFLESAVGYKTRHGPPLDRNSALWRSLWFPVRWEESFYQSTCWGPRWPAAWNWFSVYASWMVRRPQTPSGSADPSDSRAQLQPASAPGRVSASVHFLEWCQASQTFRQEERESSKVNVKMFMRDSTGLFSWF